MLFNDRNNQSKVWCVYFWLFLSIRLPFWLIIVYLSVFLSVCLSVSVYERMREGERESEGGREWVCEGEWEGGRGKGESFNCSVAHLITTITVDKSWRQSKELKRNQKNCQKGQKSPKMRLISTKWSNWRERVKIVTFVHIACDCLLGGIIVDLITRSRCVVCCCLSLSLLLFSFVRIFVDGGGGWRKKRKNERNAFYSTVSTVISPFRLCSTVISPIQRPLFFFNCWLLSVVFEWTTKSMGVCIFWLFVPISECIFVCVSVFLSVRIKEE